MAVVDVLVEFPARVNDERSRRADDEGHQRAVVAELLAPRHGKQRLGSVRFTPPTRLAELLEVLAVAPVVLVPLEQITGDDPVLDRDGPLTLGRVVLVVDLPVAVAPGATGVPELHDDAVHVRELQLELNGAIVGRDERLDERPNLPRVLGVDQGREELLAELLLEVGQLSERNHLVPPVFFERTHSLPTTGKEESRSLATLCICTYKIQIQKITTKKFPKTF